jgi:hypothetical protein
MSRVQFFYISVKKIQIRIRKNSLQIRNGVDKQAGKTKLCLKKVDVWRGAVEWGEGGGMGEGGWGEGRERGWHSGFLIVSLS